MAIITICLQTPEMTELACILFFATPNIIPGSQNGRSPEVGGSPTSKQETSKQETWKQRHHLTNGIWARSGAPPVKGNVIGGPSPTPWSSLLLSIVTQL